jgi:hypothetical protein
MRSSAKCARELHPKRLRVLRPLDELAPGISARDFDRLMAFARQANSGTAQQYGTKGSGTAPSYALVMLTAHCERLGASSRPVKFPGSRDYVPRFSNAALPPVAVVLTVNVRSFANRAR